MGQTIDELVNDRLVAVSGAWLGVGVSVVGVVVGVATSNLVSLLAGGERLTPETHPQTAPHKLTEIDRRFRCRDANSLSLSHNCPTICDQLTDFFKQNFSTFVFSL